MNSKKNLKEMVAEIIKLAQSRPPPPPPVGYTTTKPVSQPSNVLPTSGTRPVGQAANSEIAKMQQAILNFGKVLAAHPVMSMDETGQLERPGAKEPDYLGGNRPFGKFLVNQYVNNAKVVGDQFVNIDLHEPTRSATAIHNVDLKGIINTISRIGTPGAENKPDGIWQTRTDNALKQIYAVGMSLMQFGKDMKLDIGEFPELLQSLKEQILDVKGDKAQRAPLITKLINALSNLYKAFETDVLEHPDLKNLISQENAFVDHSSQVAAPLSKEDQVIFDNNKDALIPGVNINGKPVRLMDIESISAFKNFLKNVNVDIGKPGELQKNIDAVKSALEEDASGPGF